MNDTSPDPPGSSHMLMQAFPSIGIGLLVGMLVALSLSPVVAGLLSTLGGLLAGILGLQQDGADASDGLHARLRVNGLRIGAFGFACVAGVLAGMFIRTHDLFAVPVKEQIAVWEDAGFTNEQAKQFVMYQKFGFRPEGITEAVETDRQKAQMSVLYGSLGEVNLCAKVATEQFDNDPVRVLAAYRRLNLDDEQDERTPLYRRFGDMATAVERAPVEQQREILSALQRVVCEIQRLENEDASTPP